MLKVGDKIRITKIKQSLEFWEVCGIFIGNVYKVENVDDELGVFIFAETNCYLEDDEDFEYEIVGEGNMYNIEQEKQRLIAKGYDVDKYIEQAKKFYKEYLKGVEYDIDIDDVIFVNDEKETVIGHIDCLSNDWLKEILLSVLEQRNALQDEINDLKYDLKELKEEIDGLYEKVCGERRF